MWPMRALSVRSFQRAIVIPGHLSMSRALQPACEGAFRNYSSCFLEPNPILWPSRRPSLIYADMRVFRIAGMAATRGTTFHLRLSQRRNFEASTCHGCPTLLDEARRRIIPCYICLERFGSIQAFREHLTKAHEGPKNVCDICGMPHGTKRDLRRHISVHNLEKAYECDECHKLFQSENYLQKHKLYHKREKPYTCPHCNYGFLLKKDLEKHVRNQQCLDKPLQCPYCNRRYKGQKSLDKHKAYNCLMKPRELKEKPYKCMRCGSSFVESRDLTRHDKSGFCRAESRFAPSNFQQDAKED